MKKVIAVLPNGNQIITTAVNAAKNKYIVTYNVEIVPAAPETDPLTIKNNQVPKVGLLMKGIGGHIYQLSKVEPIHRCADCSERGDNRVYNLFYCNRHYKKLVITAPILKVNELPGRNAPCYCGSKRKYKQCCAKKDKRGAGHYYNSEYNRKEQNQKTA